MRVRCFFKFGFRVLAMAAVSAAIVSCGARAVPLASSDWVAAPPDGCACGMSGPTINPADALQQARLNARINLAANTYGVHIKSVIEDDGGTPHEYTQQTVEALLRDTHIVAMRVEGRLSTERVVHALACQADVSGIEESKGPIPAWLYNLSDGEGRLCALDMAGPTFDPERQMPAAEKDACRALAMRLSLSVDECINDDGLHEIRVVSRSSVDETLIARVCAEAEIAREWNDKAGVGPVGLPDVQYALACIQP